MLPEQGACLCFTKISFLFSETHSGPLRYNPPVLPSVPVPTAVLPYYPGQTVHRFDGHFMSCKEREVEFGTKAMKFTNVYIKNFGENYSDEELNQVFSAFGKKY